MSEAPQDMSEAPRDITPLLSEFLVFAAIAIAMGLFRFYNVALSHAVIALLRSVIFFSIFVLSWNSRHWSKNNYLILAGVAYLFAGFLIVPHFLSYPGMHIFHGYGANLSVQLWIADRFMESLSLLIAAFLIDRRLHTTVAFISYAIAFAVIIASIFTGMFPDCYSEETGLTTFKIASEYVISGLFIAAGVMLLRRRRRFDKDVLLLLLLSLATAIIAEIALTLFQKFSDSAVIISQYLVLLSAYCLYRAVLVTGIVRPFSLLFRSVRQKAQDLEHKVAERTAEVLKLNSELEERVALRTAALEQANNELESFSYSVSHDLRTPLRAIDGFSRILSEEHKDELSDEARRCVDVVRQAASRMGCLIDDILAFSRMSRGEVGREVVDMASLTNEVFEELRVGANKDNIRLEVGDLPAALGDRAMIRQALVNLIGNAIKFTGRKSDPLIQAGGAVEENGNSYYIKDNGAGFDMRNSNRLFGVFQRLHTNQEFEGTGIGLAIVKRIIERHGGRVWAEGKAGEGATLHFTLPTPPEPDGVLF
jgi:signal transduction histidine kinase